MYICKMHVTCGARFSEVIPDTLRDVELMVEEMVGQALLSLFGEGTVDDVTIRFVPYTHIKMNYYFIRIQAQFDHEGSILLSFTEEYVKEVFGGMISALLRELFMSAEVDAVTLIPAPWDDENRVSHSRSLSWQET